MAQAVPDRLRAIVGPEHVLQGDQMDEYGHDATFMEAPALCTVRPADTEQVAALVRECAAQRVPVVARGSGTSLVGRPVPMAGRRGGGLDSTHPPRTDPPPHMHPAAPR